MSGGGAPSSRTVTRAAEDYLKCILQEEQRNPGRTVSTGRVSQLLQVAPGTATSMARSLAENGWADYQPYAGLRLTPAGVKLATDVLRRHRLLESFLVEIVGIPWSEVHAEAERLEHAVSERLIDRIDEMLGRPLQDPHGDPIPTSEGEMESPSDRDLLTCPLDTRVEVTRITDQRVDFLRFLDRNGLRPGQGLTVRERDMVGEVIHLELAAGDRPVLGLQAAAAIRVVAPRQAALSTP